MHFTLPVNNAHVDDLYISTLKP